MLQMIHGGWKSHDSNPGQSPEPTLSTTTIFFLPFPWYSTCFLPLVLRFLTAQIFRRHFWLINDTSHSGVISLWLWLLHSPWLTSNSSHWLLTAHEQMDASPECSSRLTNSCLLMHVGILRRAEDRERNCSGSVFQKAAR